MTASPNTSIETPHAPVHVDARRRGRAVGDRLGRKLLPSFVNDVDLQRQRDGAGRNTDIERIGPSFGLLVKF